MSKKRVMKNPYGTIKKWIEDCLQQVDQWDSNYNLDYEKNKLEYMYKAEILIEILEVELCGSVGGFNKGQPHTTSLKERYDWVKTHL